MYPDETSELYGYLFSLFKKRAKFPDDVDPEDNTRLYYPMSRFILKSTILSKEFLKNPTKKKLIEIISKLCEEDKKTKVWLAEATTQKKAFLFFTYGKMTKK